MKYIALILFMLTFTFVNAAVQITNFGRPYGIVADNSEWICNVDNQDSKFKAAVSAVHNPYSYATFIKGQSKSIPLKFEFFYHFININQAQNTVVNLAHKILTNYAISSNSVISCVSIQGDSKSYFIINACFFDNTASGYITIFLLQEYVMFVELRSSIFDESTAETIMKKPFDLITPLYKPNQPNKI
jgi:hypothetical protein